MERKEFDESIARCKKCFQLGHYTYKCTASQIKYLQRPSRTKLLKKKWKDQERKMSEPKIDKIDESNENKPVEQDENINERTEKPCEDPADGTEKAGDRARNEPLRDEKLKETISEMNNEMRLNQESISKVINLIERDKKRKTANSSSSSSSSSDSSSGSSSSSSDSSSDDSDSSSSSSSSSSSDGSPARKKRRKRSGSRERRKR